MAKSKLPSFLAFCVVHGLTITRGQDSPLSLNGGSVLAMAGDECVALAVDKRFGLGAQMVNISPRPLLIPHPHLVVAFTGLESDVQSLSLDLSEAVFSKLGRGFLSTSSSLSSNHHELHDRPSQPDSRLLCPQAMARLTSHVLYSRRQSPYYVEPIVVGLEPALLMDEEAIPATTIDQKQALRKKEQDQSRKVYHRPFLCSHDVIGAQSRTDSFCCAGVASPSLYGTAEAFWKPGMQRDELVVVCGKAFLSALERDCLSGYGARLILITKNGIEEFDLACRSD